MALFDAVKKLFGEGGAEPQSDKVYIIDASSIDQDKQKQMSPHQQISVLKRLASFAKKEGISIQALLDGKPLRVVADGGDFSGVTVYFTREKMDIATLIRKRLKSVRANKITVITNDQGLEADVEASGGQLMSTSTFRKALGGGGGRSKGSSGNRRRSGSSSRRSKRGRGGSKRGGNRKGKSQKGGKKSEKDHVSDLIDLVD